MVLAVGTRLQDFTTGSQALFRDRSGASSALNVQPFDAASMRALPLVVPTRRPGSRRCRRARAPSRAGSAWQRAARSAAKAAGSQRRARSRRRRTPRCRRRAGDRRGAARERCRSRHRRLRGRRAAGRAAQAVAPREPGGYHLEYGYSCMGYEIAGGLGVKLARPDREVIVMVGDGSYLMMNSEIATSVMLGLKLDHRACSTIAASAASTACSARPAARASTTCSTMRAHETLPEIDFAAHAASLGAHGREGRGPRRAGSRAERRRAQRDRTSVIVHRHRSAGLDRGRRALVGRGGAGSLRARRGARGARGLRDGAEAAAAGRLTWRTHRHQSDRLDQRRPARARRRDAARDLPRRSQGGRLRGHGARQQVPARSRRRCAAVLGKYGLALVSGWYSAELLRRGADEEMQASAPASRSAQGARLQGAGVRRNLERDPWRPRQAARRAAACSPRRLGSSSAQRMTEVAERTLARRRAARLSPSHGHGGGERRRRSTR